MKRNLFIAGALLSALISSISVAQAENNSNHTVAVYKGACKHRPYVRVEPYRPTIIYKNQPPVVVHESEPPVVINRNEGNVYSRPGALRFFGRPISAPNLGTPPCGTEVEVGSTVTAKANFLGCDPGCVTLNIGSTSHECRVLSWGANEVVFEIPNMGVAQCVSAELQLVRPTGEVVRSYSIRLVNKPDLIVHEEPAPGSAAAQVGTYPYADTNGLVLNPGSGS